MDCKHCKSEDIRPSQRNQMERVLGYVIPVRPYRCEECDKRSWGLIRPILEKPRIITWSVLGVVALLFTLNAVMVFDVTSADETENPAEVETVDDGAANEGHAVPADDASDGDGTNDTAAEGTDAASGESGQPPSGPNPEAAPDTSKQAAAEKTETNRVAETTPAKRQADDGDAKKTAQNAGTVAGKQDEPAQDRPEPPEETPAQQTEAGPFVLRQQAKNLGKPAPDFKANDEPRETTRPQPKVNQPEAKKTDPPKTAAKRPARQVPAGKPAPFTLSENTENGVLTIFLQTKGITGKPDLKTYGLGKKLLILDFPGRFSPVQRKLTINHPIVRLVRTGTHATHIRLVLELTQTRHPNPDVQVSAEGAKIIIRP
ncbi:AMIN domain-containing protein [Acanthopleuribacter pedis]|uniref:AMIN domain-containing protein n=1 Tax=Acanthopleuribacter pedis TaxID=442870 RepID=A0A8J7Q9A7_9BACT|nr:AMIN domain-containing protein [Acanthopleuribacter pedis]MBO1319794.1 AMIN domain-containing protein [Acanthopleuribacter pedis]